MMIPLKLMELSDMVTRLQNGSVVKAAWRNKKVKGRIKESSRKN